jgi:hypothetical protein
VSPSTLTTEQAQGYLADLGLFRHPTPHPSDKAAGAQYLDEEGYPARAPEYGPEDMDEGPNWIPSPGNAPDEGDLYEATLRMIDAL